VRISTSRRLLIAAAVGALAALCSGCPELDNPRLLPPEPPYEQFVSEVQPVLSKSCSSHGCHGTVIRPLTLYAVGHLRAPPGFSTEPLPENKLTERELAWNYEAMCLRLIDEMADDVPDLLRKQLPVQDGGIDHADGFVVFADTDEPGYKALAAWIAAGR